MRRRIANTHVVAMVVDRDRIERHDNVGRERSITSATGAMTSSSGTAGEPRAGMSPAKPESAKSSSTTSSRAEHFGGRPELCLPHDREFLGAARGAARVLARLRRASRSRR